MSKTRVEISSHQDLGNADKSGFPKQSLGTYFRIPSIHLESSDRRLLSSTVESLLFRDETLVRNAVSFCRDILLADFPPETFIQESSLSQSLLQIVKESWEDPTINYVGFQTLLALANSLSTSIEFLNSSEFYQHHASSNNSQNQSYEEVNESIEARERQVSSEYFLNSYFHFLSGISRAITYKPECIYLWLLLEAYSTVLCRYLSRYKTSSITALHLNLDEVLLDVSQAFLQNLGIVNPPIVATITSNLLSNYCREGEFAYKIFTTDIRRMIWALASNSQLAHPMYAEVRNHFIENALPFEDDLRNALDSNPHDSSAEMFRSASWWKLDVINEQRVWKDKDQENNNEAGVTSRQDQEDILPQTLYGIQNAVDHTAVIDGIQKLWFHFVPLTRVKSEDEIQKVLGSSTSWRQTFYRFLSVEPTSPEDVDLLCRVLDLMSFLLRSTKNSTVLSEWIIPLVAEKDSALLRLLFHESAECISSESSTGLTTLNVSTFGLFLELLGHEENSEKLGEFFNTCGETFKLAYDSSFGSTAILHVVLKSLAHLIPAKFLKEKLNEIPAVALTLVEITSQALQTLLQNTGEDSHRNFGTIRYGSVVLAHLSNILMKNTTVRPFWISHCVPILPRLWEIENVLIRTSSLQICANITATEEGVLPLISQLESPVLLWRLAYTRLTDLTEASLVRQRAAVVLLNLINNWSQMKAILGQHLEIPRTKLLEEVLLIMKNVCWSPYISKSLEENPDEMMRKVPPPFITPNVLSLTALIIVRTIETCDEEQIHVFQENLPLLREICIKLSHVLGSFNVKESSALAKGGGSDWWSQCLISLTNGTQALISVVELDKTLASILIGDRQNLTTVLSYFGLPSSTNFTFSSDRTICDLWKNVFVLMSTVLVDSGQNFEDLERMIWNQRADVFGKLVEWLSPKTLPTYRKPALEFLNILLDKTYENRQHEEDNRLKSFLCEFSIRIKTSYGGLIGTALLNFLENSIDTEERTSAVQCLNYICLLSPTGNDHLIRTKIIEKVVSILRDLGVQAADLQCSNKKNLKSVDLLKWLLTLLTTLFCSGDAKRDGLTHHFPDVLHTLLKFIKAKSGADQTLLQITLECLINFTEEFPEGSHSLTLTTGLVGVTSRKIASPNSLYVELVSGMLQEELESVGSMNKSNANLRTIDLLLAFVNNTSFSHECRSILGKGKVLNFLARFHHTELRKWSIKYASLKANFLKILAQLTIHSDIQLILTKQVPECVEILVAISRSEVSPISLHALHILRNLSFHAGNRPRLLHQAEFLKNLTDILNDSLDLEELECAAVTLWAITSNSEKGKVIAKRALCNLSLANATKRLQGTQRSLPTDDASTNKIENLISLLDKVSNVQNSNSDNLVS